MSTFYMVRHAHAEWTPDENRPLSAQGRADAGRVADILQRYPICAIYCSPYMRARQTIAPLAARLDLLVQTEPDLRERRLGDPAAEDFLQAVEAAWSDPSFAHPGGESNIAAQRRGLAAVQRLRERHPQGHVVLSTHGNLLALIVQGFAPEADYEFWRSLTMPDVYSLSLDCGDRAEIRRLWR
jgi:2,3-bisphosphoglycerate-dependent phosphoglycerate mutase